MHSKIETKHNKLTLNQIHQFFAVSTHSKHKCNNLYHTSAIDLQITSLYVGRLCSKSVLHPAPPWLFMQSCLGA